MKKTILLCIAFVPLSVWGQTPEQPLVETHTFEEALVEKEFDTERISHLAEKYIEGTITETEKSELIDAIEDTSYLDSFRNLQLAQLEANSEQEEINSEAEPVSEDVSTASLEQIPNSAPGTLLGNDGARAPAPDGSTSLWMSLVGVLILLNILLLSTLLFMVFRRKDTVSN